ncbi:MAG: acetate--CoA ligase family protein [Proteobacteria bacterium]|nr:acetate--CoA ligase family protein [Pseudomonadota bacterium]MBI3497926.1 acetate--CoA ligase family protein [Pseudomonadota bacterium]
MKPHRLAPLLSPRAVAFLGASPRPNSPGNDMLRMVRRGGFEGAVYPVNPKYDSVEGFRCYPSLAALPEPVDHVVLSVANAGLEAALDDAIRHGVPAATIFASLYLENDGTPPLLERLSAKAKAAGMAICGGNCMGFYNDADRFWAVGFPAEREARPGHIAFISHSGSIFGALAHNDPRFRFNICVSPGQELVTSVADYMDYALELESTRVIGLFIEAVRDPAGFVAALDKAARARVPVVVLKVGRTEAAKRMALGHSGALTGDDAAHDALFRRYGVLRVDTVDELAASLLLFQQGRPAAPGGLGAILDSGGECEMIADLAPDNGIPFAGIGEGTRAALAARLDHGLEPRNPLDAWGTGRDFVGVFHDCMKALHDDPDTALLVHFADLRTGYYVHEGYLEAHKRLIGATTKPVAIATSYTQLRHDAIVREFDALGIPVLDGTTASLKAIRHLLAYRDYLSRADDLAPPAAQTAGRPWTQYAPLEEAESLALLASYGIPTIDFRLAETAASAEAAAAALGYPVALKTAAPGIMHKTDADGVRLGLADPPRLRAAYDDMAQRLGPRVLIAAMAAPGVEVMLGMKLDPQFGPVVVIGMGGVLAEVIGCVTHELAPFGQATARRALERLEPLMRLLAGARGRLAADVDGLARLIASFSAMAADFGDRVAEIDANPVIAGPKGAVVVDALVVPNAVST